MQTSNLVFLYTVEEKSISKGAAKAHVSQQCASRHLQNLEKQYGTALFNRRPVFTLTDAGRILFRALQQIYVMENKMKTSIEEISQEESGNLRLGLNTSRAKLLLPTLLKKFYERYPKVRITVSFNDTKLLVASMLKGEIDLLVGVNYKADTRFMTIPLCQDQIWFVGTESLFRQCLPAKQLTSSISLEEISRFPLVLNAPGSTLTELLQRQAAQQNLQLQGQYVLSDYELQVLLCGKGLAAAFCPDSLLPMVWKYNDLHDIKLRVFSIRDMTETLHIDLIRNSTELIPKYEKMFIKLLKESMDNKI